MPASTVRKSGGQIAEKSPPIALPIAKSISVPSTLTLGDGRRLLFWELAAKSAKGRAADIARVREPYCNKLVIDFYRQRGETTIPRRIRPRERHGPSVWYLQTETSAGWLRRAQNRGRAG